MYDDAKILQFLIDNKIKVKIEQIGFNRSEMDGRWVYHPWQHNKFAVWLEHNNKKRMLPIYENISCRELSRLGAMHNILSHLRDLGIYSSFEYWFKESSAKELYTSLLETKKEDETKQSIYGYVQRTYGYQKSLENKLLDLLGKELYEQFYALTGD